MGKLKRNEAITLVALVVTIVILLILAGITITYVLGDNSIFKQATDAKLQTELAKIEEKAGIIYADKLLEKVSTDLNSKPTMQEIVDELKNQGEQIEEVAVEGSEIAGISLDKESMNLGFGSTGEIKATIEISNGMNYYAVVSEKYYKMNFNGGIVTIDRTASEILGEGEVVTPLLTVISGDKTIATVSIDNNTKTVTVVAKNEGTTTVTVNLEGGSNYSATCTITVTPPKVADIVDQIQDKNREIEDENGNKITIPGGFKVVADTEENDVDYTYSGDKKPSVQDGIVIEDEEGNQFVWIPVGDIKNKDGTTTTITLGRYTFNASNGMPTLQQNADNYTETVTIESYYQELTSDSGNTAAKNLGDFVTKTKEKGGYYLGRYEASQGTDGKVKSQYGKTVWTNITQPKAAIAAQGMYNSNYVESDLINSYSWDTTIVFVQNYSGNSNYANKKGTDFSTIKLNTGKAGDKICNIHDMASNCWEWSTENSTDMRNSSSGPCVVRGGNYYDSVSPMSVRVGYSTTVGNTVYSFRPLCYVK